MKRTLGRLCVLALLATAGLLATTTPAQAAQGYAGAYIAYNQSTKTLTYAGNGWGWGSTDFYIEGWLYNGSILQEHITRSKCVGGSCHLPTGTKFCPFGGLWKYDVWAFPTSGGYQPAHDNDTVAVI
jgi:hypothetical protein